MMSMKVLLGCFQFIILRRLAEKLEFILAPQNTSRHGAFAVSTNCL